MSEERFEIPYDRYLNLTLQRLLDPGLLLVARGGDGKRPNAMTIGWASFGVIWGLPVCVVLVRPSRYTYGLIEACGDFTVNVLPADLASAASICGTLSGRDHDKLAMAGLHPVEAQAVSSPILAEALIAYECKVVHKNDVLPDQLAAEVQRSCYPKGDYHRLYFGQILRASARPSPELA
jgi:flavin reductase (DIM6/NTAB) family NADH-FMN oxidoreductase RutF